MLSRRNFLKMSLIAASALCTGNAFAEDSPLFASAAKSADDNSVFLNQDYFKKIKEFDHPFPDDMIAPDWEKAYVISCSKKLYNLQRAVGHGNFNVMNYDQARYVMRRNSSLEPFNPKEEAYIEMLFHRDAVKYGFLGEKVMTNITDSINRKDIIKMKGTGHFLYKEHAVATYEKIVKDMNTLILTSGVRGIVKQLYLFLNKAVLTDGNLSMASRSLAPVGYSFHGAGDFDVGIRGWGADNFTDRFATTSEYVNLINAGYMRIRYDRKNPYGVRFEPWHVKVV